jgi:hypothetical protein
MTFIKRNLDYILVGIPIILLGIIPVINFVRDYLGFIDYGSDQLALIEFWYYTFSVTNVMWYIMISPVIIIFISSYRFHRNFYSENLLQESFNQDKMTRTKNLVLNSWVKSGLILLSISLFIFLVGIIVPTTEYYPYDHMNIDKPITLFIFTNTNMVIFSLFVANIAIIISRFTKKYIVVFIYSLVAFISILLGLTVIGGAIENALNSNFNMDWLWLYNSFFFDSGTTIAFSTIFILTLFMISSITIYIVYKGNKDLDE